LSLSPEIIQAIASRLFAIYSSNQQAGYAFYAGHFNAPIKTTVFSFVSQMIKFQMPDNEMPINTRLWYTA